MLMKDNKKNIATAIVSKMKNRPQPLQDAPQSAGAEVADADDLYIAAEEVMKALETRDIRGFKEAMEAMVEMCMHKYRSSEPAMEPAQETEMG